MSEGSHAEGDCTGPEELSVDASPPQDLSQPASPSLSSPRDVDEPLTPRMEVHSGEDTFSGSFDTAADTPGPSPAGCLSNLDNTYVISPLVSLWPRFVGLAAYDIMQDEGEFDHYHNHVMAIVI